MSALREILAYFKPEWDEEPLDEADEQITTVNSGLLKLGATILAGIGLNELKNQFNEISTEADRIGKAATTLDVTVEQLQAVERAAEHAGVPIEQVSIGMKQVQLRSKQAAEGSKTMAAAFDSIGLEASELAELNPQEQFIEVGSALSTIENPARRNAIAMELLGEQGAGLNRIFAEGEEATREMLAQYEKIAPITTAQSEAMQEMNDAMLDADKAFLRIKVILATIFVPIITWVAEKLEKVSLAFGELAKETNLFESILITLAGAITVYVVPAVLSWVAANKALLLSQLKMMAILALIVLVVDEVITTFQGGDTLIRRAIDGMFGEGTTKKIVDFMKEVWVAIKNFKDNIPLALDQLEKDFDALMFWLNDWITDLADDFEYVYDAITEPFIRAWNKVKEIVGKITGKASSMASSVKGFFGFGNQSMSAPVSSGASGASNQSVVVSGSTFNIASGSPQETASVVDGVLQTRNNQLAATQAALVPQGA